MPTGYTSKLHDENVPFDEFVMTCARNFGAFVSFRDEPISILTSRTEINLRPSKYTYEKFKETQEELLTVCNLNEEQAYAEAMRDYEAEVRRCEKSQAEHTDALKRYSDMKAQIEAWEPPSEDHRTLKEFCIEQIETSIQYDCTSIPFPKSPLSGAEWRKRKIESLTHDLNFYLKEWHEEKERVESRNKWIRELQSSLREQAETNK